MYEMAKDEGCFLTLKLTRVKTYGLCRIPIDLTYRLKTEYIIYGEITKK